LEQSKYDDLLKIFEQRPIKYFNLLKIIFIRNRKQLPRK